MIWTDAQFAVMHSLAPGGHNFRPPVSFACPAPPLQAGLDPQIDRGRLAALLRVDHDVVFHGLLTLTYRAARWFR